MLGASCKDTVLGAKDKMRSDAFKGLDDGLISDDDPIEDSDDESWFGMGMTRDEKNGTRRPWTSGVIIKLVGLSNVSK